MSERPVPHVWAYAVGTSWAILPDRLPAMLDILARLTGEDERRVEAVAARLGRPLDNARAAVRVPGTDIASIPIEGVIFPRASLFSAISGGLSVDEIATDLTTMLDDPSVAGIVLDIDSPGGDINGVAELAGMIHAARDRKPIVAYIRHLGASAAYWLAAAASEVVVASTAIVGSIGIVGTVADPTKQTTRNIEFASSKSPHKRTDPHTQAGAARILAQVDAHAEIFIADVAHFRGVTTATVEADFGQGDVLVGQQAVTAGMADRVGTFEGVVADLQQRAREPRRIGSGGRMAARGGVMAEQSRQTEEQQAVGFMAHVRAFFTGEGAPTPAIPPAPTPAPLAAAAPGPAADPETERLRAELARYQEAERTRATADLDARAAAFAEGEITASRALPAERAALVAAYADAARDDADHPRPAGQESRVARLEARQKERPAHRLTTETVPVRPNGDGTLTILGNAERTRAAGEPAPMTPERWRALYAHTATGQAILREHGIPATGALSAAHRDILATIIQQKGLATA